MLLFFVFSLMALTLPVLGPLLSKLVAPAFTAGMMVCCFKLSLGQEFKVADVLVAVRERGAQLLRLGLIYTVLLLLLSYVVVLFFSHNGGQDFIQSMISFNQELLDGKQPDTSNLVMPEPVVALKTALFWILCYLPILMLITFAPILVWKYQLGVFESMRISFIAIWRNRAAMCRYVVALIALLAIYLVPLLLFAFIVGNYASGVIPLVGTVIFVISMLIIKPIIIISAYAAHKDLFLSGGEYLAA